MGGGAMFRSMARLVGAATVGAAAAPASGAFCHVHPPASASMKQQESFSSVLNLSHEGVCSANPNPKEVQPLVDVRFVDQEEWECPQASSTEKEGGGGGGAALRRLVFAPPTEEEVEEATKELHAALHLSIPASGLVIEGNSQPGITAREDNMDLIPRALDKEVMDTSPPSVVPSNHLGILTAGSSSVMQAFQLLQTNPQVQNAVKSLARDPAVWKAVLSNEKVQELTQSLHDTHESCSDEKVQLENEDYNLVKLTSKVCDFVTGKVLQLFHKVVVILNSMFGSVEKTIFSKEGTSAMDKTVASCMMLAVAVLIVVVMKRMSLK